LSVAAGPFANSAIGFTGNTIIEIGRLLDSTALRHAVTAHPAADVVALVSDRLHADVVGEGYPGLDATHFEQIPVQAKTYRKPAWLWTGTPTTPHAPVRETGAPSERDVFVIHGGHEPARAALFDFLRALGLRPLQWEELITRTGSPAPYRDQVLRRAFADNRAAVVLLTPDGDGPTTLVEAGMALALQPERTVLVQIGGPPGTPGPGGRDAIHLDAKNSRALQQLAQRLRMTGCAVDTDGTDWLDLDRFDGLG